MFSLQPPRHISTLPKAPLFPIGQSGRSTPMTGPTGRLRWRVLRATNGRRPLSSSLKFSIIFSTVRKW
jgi:hypothetical protein